MTHACINVGLSDAGNNLICLYISPFACYVSQGDAFSCGYFDYVGMAGGHSYEEINLPSGAWVYYLHVVFTARSKPAALSLLGRLSVVFRTKYL